MTAIHKKKQDLSVQRVFDDLCLSRRILRKAEATQTLPSKDKLGPGALPDEDVASIIEMLRPTIGQMMKSRKENKENKEETEVKPEKERKESEIEEICVKNPLEEFTKEQSKAVLKEIFDDLCLSRRCVQEVNDLCPSRKSATEVEELPQQEVTAIIEMLSSGTRANFGNPNHEKDGMISDCERYQKSMDYKEEEPRPYKSEPTIQKEAKKSGSKLKMSSRRESESSFDSTFTLKSTVKMEYVEEILLEDNKKEGEPPRRRGKNNTDVYTNNCKRRRSNKSRTSSFYHHAETAPKEDTCTHHPTGHQEDRGEELVLDHGDTAVESSVTILRNTTDWKNSPFTPKDGSESPEDSISIISEPTRGFADSFKYNIQQDNNDQGPSTFEREVNRFKAMLNSSGDMAYDERYKEDWAANNYFGKAQSFPTDYCTAAGMVSGDSKMAAESAPSVQGSLHPREKFLSQTSLSSLSCCTCCQEEKSPSVPCFCDKMTFVPSCTPGEPKVYWAITKINVYPDNSRTYEVMPLTGKKPSELPEKSDSVFVLIPPKQRPFVPCKM